MTAMTGRVPLGSGRKFGLDSAVGRLSPAERAKRGKAARSSVPRESQAVYDPSADRADPVSLLERQAVVRLPDLVPVWYGRMLASPFSYYRGAALAMAADLAATPVSGLAVQACGDAHLSNFGVYASPERALVFDLNDFDETLPGPWEWDVKRLAASLEVAGRENGYRRGQCRNIVTAAVCRYREAMRGFAGQANLAVWYARADVAELREQFRTQLSGRTRKKADQVTAKARTRDSIQALGKLARLVDGRPRIVADPPLVVPVDDLLPADADRARLQAELTALIASCRRSLGTDRRYLLEQFELADIARKVVGVGSVGTRCWIVLMLGRDRSDPLFLQVKEARPSVLEDFAGASKYANHGQRVVAGQRLMQAASDIFLGWHRSRLGPDAASYDFYIRQLRDWKASADVETMAPAAMRAYGELCGWTLARAHARSGDRIAIAAYLGRSSVFDQAIREFAAAYADQNERDHSRLAAASKAGRVVAEPGV
ncbi:MAG TPA: DUF2252 domain-containing protein [Streptosporangiaceae bacterium]